jgi:hypothetical protein
MKLITMLVLMLITTQAKSANITIVVMDAFTLETCSDCKIQLSGRGTKNKTLNLNNDGERYITYKSNLTVEPITNKHNYFGIVKSYKKFYEIYRDTVWIYPNNTFEQEYLKKNRCPIKKFESDDEDKVSFDSLENAESAEFPGDFSSYLDKNLYYPEIALENGDDGRLIAGFIVEKDGSISCPMIIQSISKEIDAEALRVIRMMPNWIPASIDQHPVRLRLKMPILFRY